MEWKIFLHIDTTLGNKADCSITSLVASALPIVPVKVYACHLKFA